jgi:hypothetical protein
MQTHAAKADPPIPLAHREGGFRVSIRRLAFASLPLLIFGFLADRTLWAAPPAATQPATQPHQPSYLDQERDTQKEFKEEVEAMTPAVTLHRDALERISLDDGRVAVEIGGLEIPDHTRIDVSDSDGLGLAREQTRRFRRAVRPHPTLVLDRYDFDQTDPDAIWVTFLSAGTALVTLSGETLNRRIVFTENPDQLMLSIKEKDPQASPEKSYRNYTGRSMADLRNAHPAEYRQFLLPLIGKLTDTSWFIPGAADVYEIFSEIPADDASTAQLQTLLLSADSTVPAEREQALQQMEGMGARGVLAAMRFDAAKLAPEQQAAVATLIAHGRRARVADPAAARKDPDFLLNCLEIDGPGLKAAALRQLSSVLGKPVTFDVNLSGAAALAAVDALRVQILGDTANSDPSN